MTYTTTFYIATILISLIIVLYGKYKNEKRTNYLHENRNPKYYPLVSVIIPCYNEEAVIGNTIRAVEKNSYKNFEIIVIDDNSTDSTFEIAKGLEKEYNNLKVIKKKGEKGKPQSINEAMEIAKGEIVLIIDADARIPENYISSHVYCFSNPKVEMIFTNFEAYNFRFTPVFIIQEIYFNFVKTIFYSNIIVKMIFMGNGIFFRKSLLERILPIDPTTLVDDFSMATKLSKLKVKEFYSTYPYIKIQFAKSFKDLWKQHKRWYTGGFREMFMRIKEGHHSYLFYYMLTGLVIFLPVISLFVDLIFHIGMFKIVFGLIMAVYILLWISSLDSRQFGFFSLFYSFLYVPLLMIFELLILVYSYITGPFNKKLPWEKVERDKI
ncbi:glycosyl transferase [Thermosipho melanesiensis]|uniref:Glycosyl transferase, family 2 n=2 Tax=Thermosipho melanesiensis TaxID=46541 RepID=A6LJJ1_THEM4|nr:glycosyltransferase [Thermosipho melanesiensis]ABR30092.1 glycosyl transferase, family 2 [Thermosipho melanesiensis BI429]APT73289.1 glycosyl transferase [Thermosipho melanesiensis]OOC38681.1 glycosyl transferase [Thermosipho melanesiensis]OOC40485.1 glycosyl transferase [Thermosipho melanesiensis]OOC40750.1 glycosyl transferase [Thermosipho melanesiensis]